MTGSNATELLRGTLKERGVKMFHSGPNVTYFETPYGEAQATEYEPGVLGMMMRNLTPEQAIAATLGSGMLTVEQVRETYEKHWHDLSDEYDMPEASALPGFSYDWQAIADELNARAERTCRNDSMKRGVGVFVCSQCGVYLDIADMSWDGKDDSGGFYEPTYCPNCGKAVKR